MREPLLHQRRGLDFVKSRDRVALFWEMRLGKTLVAIRWAVQRGCKRILVVAPLPVIDTWEEELELEEQPVAGLLTKGTVGNEKLLIETAARRGWWLTNYESLTIRKRPDEERNYALASEICSAAWDCVILDESTRIRSPKAGCTQAAVNVLAEDVPCRMLLSGLPDPEGLDDYFEQMRFLTGSFMGCTSFWQWRQRFFTDRWDPFKWHPKKGTRAQIFDSVNEVAHRLTRAEVKLGNPKVRETRHVFLSGKIERAYKTLERDFVLGETLHKYAVGKRVKAQRLAGGFPDEDAYTSKHKLNELVSLLKGELKNDSVLVFFRFNRELENCYEALKKAKIKTVRLSGKTPREDRAKLRRQFQAGKARVALCQTRLVRYGLNFSRASAVIYYSNWDELEIRAQSEDRAVSPLETQPVLILDLATKNTVDEDIVYSLKNKKATASLAKLRRALIERAQERSGKK